MTWLPIPLSSRGGFLIEHKFVQESGLLRSSCGLVEREDNPDIDWHDGPNGIARCDKCEDA